VTVSSGFLACLPVHQLYNRLYLEGGYSPEMRVTHSKGDEAPALIKIPGHTGMTTFEYKTLVHQVVKGSLPPYLDMTACAATIGPGRPGRVDWISLR